MRFLHPEFIYFMLPPLILLFALFLTQKEKQAVFFSEEVMKKLRVNSKRMSLRARNALFFLVALLLIISLAQPVVPDGKVQVHAKSADIMLALDISDSMLCTDLYPSRLDLAKHKVVSLLSLMPDERVGVVAFAKESYLVSPLSFDHDAISFLVKGLSSDSITQKGTDFLELLEGVDESMKEQKKRTLLLFSDGGDQSDFSVEIAYAKEHHITVFVLGIGTVAGAPIKAQNGFVSQNGKVVISKLNPAIASFATQTGGVYIEGVSSDKDVKKMLSEIQATIAQKTLKSQIVTKYIPLFHIPIGFALFFLLIAVSSMGKREVVNVPSVFTAIFILFASVPSNAGILDFKHLGDAKKAYENKEYKTSSALYGDYLKEHDISEANYNYASSLYKEKNYSKAANYYKKVHFPEKDKQADVLYNLGNAYAKAQNFEEAISAYKNSLSLKQSEDTKVNKAIVEKLYQEQKKKEQQQNSEQQNKDSKEQNKQEQQNKDPKEQEQKNSQNQELQNAPSASQQNEGMSNKEEQKWLQRLNVGSPTHMYKIKTSSKKDNKNEKPW